MEHQNQQASYLESVVKQFSYYRMLGEKAMEQITEEQLFWQYNDDSNSIAVIVNHLAGNMLSRWKNFLTEDGEKEWRNRDSEFEDVLKTRADLMQKWAQGWDCLFNALNSIADSDLSRLIYIRNQGHTVMEAINRQLAHYPYHVGQIVFIAKMLAGTSFKSLSIPKGNSGTYNAEKFSTTKSRAHFTDEFLSPKNHE